MSRSAGNGRIRGVATIATSPPLENALIGRVRCRARLFPSQFWLLVAGTFVFLLGYEIGYPFETVYLHTHLGVSMTAIGLILGLPILAGLPLQIVGGAVADRFGRKVVLVTAVCAAIVLFGGLAVATDVRQAAAIIAVEAMFGWAMFLTADNSMLADLTPPARRGDAYGISRTAMNAGMVAGPLVAALLLGAGLGYRGLFTVGALVCCVFLALALAFLRDSRPADSGLRPEGSSPTDTTLAGYRVVFGDRRFVTFCAVALLPLYGFGQIYVTLPILLHTSVGVTSAQWGLLAALYAGCGVLCQYPVVRRTRRLDKLRVLALASVCIGVGMSGAAFAPRGVGTAVCVVLVSAGSMLLVPIAAAFVSQMAPVELRGRYMGAWTLVWEGGAALAPIFGGLLLDHLGRASYLVLLAVCLLGAALFGTLRVRWPAAD